MEINNCEVTGLKFKIWRGVKVYEDEWHLIDKAKKRADKLNCLYLTLSPDKFSRNLQMDQLDDLKQWCSKWFTAKNKYYEGGVYVIENGSKGDHLHVHCLLQLRKADKHARALKSFWERWFPGSPLLTSLNLCARSLRGTDSRGEYCYAIITDREIAKDKLEYFLDENKGAHENFSKIMDPCFFGLAMGGHEGL